MLLHGHHNVSGTPVCQLSVAWSYFALFLSIQVTLGKPYLCPVKKTYLTTLTSLIRSHRTETSRCLWRVILYHNLLYHLSCKQCQWFSHICFYSSLLVGLGYTRSIFSGAYLSHFFSNRSSVLAHSICNLFNILVFQKVPHVMSKFEDMLVVDLIYI